MRPPLVVSWCARPVLRRPGGAREARRQVGDDGGRGAPGGAPRRRPDPRRAPSASTCPVASAGGLSGGESRDGHAPRPEVHLAHDIVIQGFRRLERAAQHAMRRARRGRCREGLGEDGVLPAGAQERFHIDGMRRGLLGGQEPRAHPRGSRPAARTAATDRALAMPPAAITGTRTASSTSSSSGSRPIPPFVRPPASIPRATTMSHPAASAARASSAEMICQLTSAPPDAARATSAGVGSPRYSSTSGACTAALSSALSSNSGSMRSDREPARVRADRAQALREIGERASARRRASRARPPPPRRAEARAGRRRSRSGPAGSAPRIRRAA